jgi:hypothetical protein
MAVKRFLLLALVFSVMATTAPALADGDFYVVAVGGGVGTKITSLPYTIISPGFYYLGGNLTAAAGNGITIGSDGVTLDLMGFCLNGNVDGDGIYMYGRKNVEIRNGTLRGWRFAIFDSPPTPTPLMPFNHRVINIRAEGNAQGLIFTGSGHLIKGCSFLNNTGNGINASGTVSGNQIHNCLTGIINVGGTTRDNAVTNCDNGIFGGGTITGNTVVNNTSGTGTGITCNYGSVIGNTVSTRASGQTGIQLYSTPVVMDQNTVDGSGTHYAGGGSSTVWAGKSADNPWGSNAGHP